MASNNRPLPPLKPKTLNHTSTNGYTTEANTACPPTSPRRHSSFLHYHRRLQCKAHSHRRREKLLPGVFLQRNLLRFFLLLVFLYLSSLITYVGPLFALLHPPLPGSVYRSHVIFQKLWHEIQSDNSSGIELSTVWRYKRKLKEQKPCLNSTAGSHFGIPGPDHYLIIEANGGLNQQRSAICNAVAVARLLDAILVIPHFDYHHVWKDPSVFGDIYDEDHFITTLKDYVKVVRELPEELLESYDFNISSIPNIRVEAWSPASYYVEEVFPVLRKKRVIRIAPFANRLATHLPPHIQFLRCLANYKALRFSAPISTLAKKLVNRMTEKSLSFGGKYVSVHLRFEEDMLAFSCCVYDGGEAEKSKMDKIRKEGWRGKFTRNDRLISPGSNRIDGKCPMTPLEVGMMLRGMGFASNTSIYLASGEIYDAKRNLSPLLKMFPLLQTKESLATPDELALLKGYSSRLAALDYMVCLSSEVFVATQGGNFPHFLMGHRRFLYGGHAKTIKPDKHKLVFLLHNTSISWREFKNQVGGMLAESDRKGIMVPRIRKTNRNRKTSIYSNPLPECRCLWECQNSTL